MKTQTLKTQWQELLESEPQLRIRDAARRLGVSEAELLNTRLGDGVTRLGGDPKELLRELPKLGRVMCLTRNEHAVHERHGEFRQVEFFHGMGQVVGPDIDLRIFPNAWHFGFAVTDAARKSSSFQFFDACGTAVHKVFLQPGGSASEFHRLVDKYRAADSEEGLEIRDPAPRAAALPDAEIDVEGFREAWMALLDTHDFFPLLKKFRVGREQALRLAPEGFARSVSTQCVQAVLEGAAASQTPIMVFVGSPGCLQIHTGPVKNIRMLGTEWLNVLDDEFNLHLHMSGVASAWIVRKPTRDGEVTSLELFDSDGENLALFFGRRKPGEAEDPAWRVLLGSVQ
jgi:putative hemin transport protein